MNAVAPLATGLLLGAMIAAPQHAAACDMSAPDAARAGPRCAEAWMDHALRVDDIMTVGTHNSYKQAISPPLLKIIAAKSPTGAQALDYAHAPLDAQLDDGARAIELDVAYDPEGGRFAHPLGARIIGEHLPAGFAEAMAKPGFKVLHIQDIDFRSSCLTFVACLRIVRAWSLAHPRHTPILITLNAKDEKSPAPGGVGALPFDAAAYDALDAEIRAVFPAGSVVTPDVVQGRHSTLRDAVLHGGWPTLGAARGKVLFALDEDPAKVAVYRGARRSLEGRMMFINTDEASPAAAYLTLNEAQDPAERMRIARNVKAGFLVRTRADADTKEARTGDTSRRDAALASGAQYVSTDYMTPDTRFGPYQVRLPVGAIAVCNPQRRPERCSGLPVEVAPK